MDTLGQELSILKLNLEIQLLVNIILTVLNLVWNLFQGYKKEKN